MATDRGQESGKENKGTRKELMSTAEAGGGGSMRGMRRCGDAGDATLISGQADVAMLVMSP